MGVHFDVSAHVVTLETEGFFARSAELWQKGVG